MDYGRRKTMDIYADSDTSFHLKVLGYEFPDKEHEEWDSNWLRIHMAATLPQGAWSVSQPFLLTFEVERLADWLAAVSTGMQAKNEIHFVEPNLAFELIETNHGKASLRIHFAMECLPPWEQRSEQARADVYADFPLSAIDLHAAAKALRSQLRTFPQRATH
jgi:hypothetical protein